MSHRITKKQNIVIDGVKYKAVAEPSPDHGCHGCEFRYGNPDRPEEFDGCSWMPCTPSMRDDHRAVIFVKVPNPWIKVPNGFIPVLTPDTPVEWVDDKGARGFGAAGELNWDPYCGCRVIKYRLKGEGK